MSAGVAIPKAVATVENPSWTSAAHGHVVGTVITSLGVKAQADNADTLSAGIVSEVVDTNTFRYQSFGAVSLGDANWIAVNDDAESLIAGEYYYLSQTTAGNITKTPPTVGYLSPIGFAQSTTTFVFLPYQPSAVNDDTVMTVNTAAGHFRVGDLLFQWGNVVSNNDDAQPVVFPTAYDVGGLRSLNKSVSANGQTSGTYESNFTLLDTSDTGFNINRHDANVSNAHGAIINWWGRWNFNPVRRTIMATNIALSGTQIVNFSASEIPSTDWGDGASFDPANVDSIITITESKIIPRPSSLAGESIIGKMITLYNDSTSSVAVSADTGAVMSGQTSISSHGTITVYIKKRHTVHSYRRYLMPFLAASTSSGLSQWRRTGHAVGDLSQMHTVDVTGFTPLVLLRSYPLDHPNPDNPTDSARLSNNADYPEAEINDLMNYSRLSEHKVVAPSTPYEFIAVWWNDPASQIYVRWTQNQSPLDMVDDQVASSIVKILDSSGANWEGDSGTPTDGFYGLRLDSTGAVTGRDIYLSSSLVYGGLGGGTGTGPLDSYQTGYYRDENKLVGKRARNFDDAGFPAIPEYYGNFALHGKI